MIKSELLRELSLKNLWNRTYRIYGENIIVAGVMWDSKPWKVIHEGIGFDELTKTTQIHYTDKIFKNLTYGKRTYKPIAEFRTQLELAEYLMKEVFTPRGI